MNIMHVASYTRTALAHICDLVVQQSEGAVVGGGHG